MENTHYSSLFSKDTTSFFRSPVRDIFKKVDLNAICSFAGGYPPAEAFPVEEIGVAIKNVISRYGSRCFQYGPTQGAPELRTALASRYGVNEDRIQVTTSSQQGIDVCTRILVDPGDVILTSNPTYLGALQSFKSYRACVHGVPHIQGSQEYAQTWRQTIIKLQEEGHCIKFLYIIPDFQNPSGETLSLEERHILAELSQQYGFIIIEDSPYRELRYEGNHIPSIYSLAPDRVLHLGSFSKILAPGFRLGWILGHPDLLDKIYVCKQSLDLCAPLMEQFVAEEFIRTGLLDANIEKNIQLYRHKRDTMLALLEKHMPQGVTWTKPEGGLFLWLTLPESINVMELYDNALGAGVAYVAGNFFRTDGKGFNTMRLNFSFIKEERMEEGISILSSLLKERCQ